MYEVLRLSHEETDKVECGLEMSLDCVQCSSQKNLCSRLAALRYIVLRDRFQLACSGMIEVARHCLCRSFVW